MYKLIAFDLDGTLTKSKLPMTKGMSDLLEELSLDYKIAIISGGSLEQFKKQLLPFIKPSLNITLLPTDGSERFEYDEVKKDWKMTDREIFPKKIKEKVIKVLEEIISSGDYDIPKEHKGEYIDDRDTEITFSALGQKADLKEKDLWDPDQKKRQKIKEEIEKRLKDVTASVAGTTSIDILPKGFNKAVGLDLLLQKMNLTKKDIIFVGDAIFPGGNDYSPLEEGMETIKTSGPEETEEIIKKILGQKNDKEEVIKLPNHPIAFFCAEYALEDDPSMYAGGLGVLAGDYVMEIADRNMPFVAVGLNYGPSKLGGFEIFKKGSTPFLVRIPVAKDCVYAQVWHRTLAPNTHIFLLDTNIKENSEENKKITSHLYDPHFYTRIKQQMILGMGGVRLLKNLDIDPIIYHMNEGHTAFGGIGIFIEKKEDLKKVVASKHTILSAAGLMISKKDFSDLMTPYCREFGIDILDVFEKGKFELDPDIFSTTKFLMNIAQRKNSVSALHAVFEKKRHPHSVLFPITNGVYKKRWQAKELLSRSATMSNDEIWEIRRKLRSGLVTYVKNVTGRDLNPDICTIVWARRFAAYKRPFLMFSDYKRIVKIISNQETPVQFVIAGKAHESDSEGQDIIRKIIELSDDPMIRGRIVYIPNYSIGVAHELVRGADIWLNTPERGKEACGTSGMKASLNGALQLSISDGWVDEVNWGGRGWILPEENTAQVMYDLLEHEILPSFYAESEMNIPKDWIQKVRSTIELVEKSFTTAKMLENYKKELYLL